MVDQKMYIDVNCDMGESYGNFQIGHDDDIMPYITSCNIACGFHGGDPYHIEKTIEKAIQYGLSIGAHPSYPDLAGFGRRYMAIPAHQLKSLIKYQVGALKSLVEYRGANLDYVKPHGALYNRMSVDVKEAQTVIEAIKELDPQLKIMIMAGGRAQDVAEKLEARVITEAFMDRRYTAPTLLAERTSKDAVILNGKEAVEQFIRLVSRHEVRGLSGEIYRVHPQSICVHGDNPSAVEILKNLHKEIKNSNILLKSISPDDH